MFFRPRFFSWGSLRMISVRITRICRLGSCLPLHFLSPRSSVGRTTCGLSRTPSAHAGRGFESRRRGIFFWWFRIFSPWRLASRPCRLCCRCGTAAIFCVMPCPSVVSAKKRRVSNPTFLFSWYRLGEMRARHHLFDFFLRRRLRLVSECSRGLLPLFHNHLRGIPAVCSTLSTLP